MAEFDFTQAIGEARAKYESIAKALDVDRLKADIKDLETQAAAPGLWDDPENAQKITSRLSAAESQLKRLNSASQRIDDVETLVELGHEEGDQDSLDEAQSEIGEIQKDLDQMEIQTLLDGEYDERSAVVTIRSGAGGVDAADFAQMLLRMYLRYCERNGFKAKVMDTSYAEEAGIKSATFQVDAPYAYGRLSVEGGTHRLVRISPFDNQGRRQTSFAAVEVVPLVEATDHIDIPDTDIRVDTYCSSGPGGQGGANARDGIFRNQTVGGGEIQPPGGFQVEGRVGLLGNISVVVDDFAQGKPLFQPQMLQIKFHVFYGRGRSQGKGNLIFGEIIQKFPGAPAQGGIPGIGQHRGAIFVFLDFLVGLFLVGGQFFSKEIPENRVVAGADAPAQQRFPGIIPALHLFKKVVPGGQMELGVAEKRAVKIKKYGLHGHETFLLIESGRSWQRL